MEKIDYRAKEAEMDRLARTAEAPEHRAEYLRLRDAWREMAEAAEREQSKSHGAQA